MVVVKVHPRTPVARASPPSQLFIHLEIGRTAAETRTKLQARVPSKSLIRSSDGLKAGVTF
jgi:hypothetical protein